MTRATEGEATIVLMPYKSMMRALYGMAPLAYESCRITVPHTPLQPQAHCMGPPRAGQDNRGWPTGPAQPAHHQAPSTKHQAPSGSGIVPIPRGGLAHNSTVQDASCCCLQ